MTKDNLSPTTIVMSNPPVTMAARAVFRPGFRREKFTVPFHVPRVHIEHLLYLTTERIQEFPKNGKTLK